MPLPFVTMWNAEKEARIFQHPDKDQRKELFLSMAKAIHSLENAVGVELSMLKEEKDKDNYNNITAGYYKFLVMVSEAIRFQQQRFPMLELDFVDLGCGLGTKGRMAEFLGVKSRWGVDNNPKYLSIAARLDNKIIEADLFDYAKSEQFKRHNLIYWYSPIRNQERLAKLLIKIIKNASDDAILIPASIFDMELVQGKIEEIGWMKIEVKNVKQMIYYKETKK